MDRSTFRLDTSGLLCPMPVLKARRKLAEMEPGQSLQVIATDPSSLHDMPAYCSMAGHSLLMAEEKDNSYIFEIVCGDQANK